ncbi:MAG: hypothetical protein ABS76_09035 [Pelagibacterium sp. SCN 64-44]|nr:MAG: hypothetical protein ABS76_09035 [Pelagibacterium sp. SCN 64-44]
MRRLSLSPLSLVPAAVLAGLMLAGCSMGGIATAPGALSPGLSARMDQPNASLDRAQAIDLVNAYRAASGVAPLAHDSALDGSAQALANQYAQTGNPPSTPQGLKVMKLSAGYATFAETFSGWRNNSADAAGLRASAAKAGVGVAFNPGSAYGIHWVLILAD